MTAESKDTGPVITRDREKGWVLEEGNRIITFRVKTFQSFVDRMISLVGKRVAEMILYQMGNEIGHVAYKYSEDRLRSDEDLGRVLDDVVGTRGWGRCGDFERQVQSGALRCTLTVTGTPFSYERTSLEPTCHIVRGVVAGYLESHFGRKAQSSIEKECASTGSKVCVFEVTFPRLSTPT